MSIEQHAVSELAPSPNRTAVSDTIHNAYNYSRRRFMRMTHADGTVTDGNGEPVGRSADSLLIRGFHGPITTIGGIQSVPVIERGD